MTAWGDYTPGPWRLVESEDVSGVTYGVLAHAGPGYDETSSVWLSEEQTEPDARLISKAYLIPRLEAALDACEEYLLLQGTDRAAIALTMGLTSVLAELRTP